MVRARMSLSSYPGEVRRIRWSPSPTVSMRAGVKFCGVPSILTLTAEGRVVMAIWLAFLSEMLSKERV